jgi:hypothetical protein
MPLRTRRERFDVPRQHGVGAGLRRWTIPAIGALTPVGLIVVNIAAFIVHHLGEFRLGISVLAFVSGVLLNSWTGLNIYRVAKTRLPHVGLFHDSNQELVLVVGLLLIIIISFVEALFCYMGLANEKDLPNAATFYLGVVAIAIPIVLQVAFGRFGRGGHGDRDKARVDGYPTPPPAAPGDSLEPL